ncbi:organic solute transporter ostalpha domain-containing protein [Hirsutella rhossiliensis]|uniref:Organic solute transporter ostalpha domain-containing protein n=1 Tax=Hirsutella rhossiliensis TaxID=111463 RepID=A0A9P8MRN9_9HYPO|nr:organic solute transporter ostalpha domain-containing protein [Hirsutella rhossiliensis]KAH0961003.1 organic solute transporter ostalpha domain-containing protein [Hirsutella rhossiliensis]
MNQTCNSTLEEMRIMPGDEVLIVGPLDFHDLARVIAASCTLIAVVMSLYLVSMHARNYTQPREQRHIIRLLFMVPVYAVSSFCQIQWYWHAIYFQVISDCYEAFAIASFFALFCHYVAPDLHSQKAFFREMRPIKPWVMPVNWFAACCGRNRGPWRTPKSGLTWFNIIWIGIYHYCFIRVAMTISAVVLQYFERYCESSNRPVFGHIWIITINALAVTVAMFCLIQFYVQLREPLAEHRVLLKIVAIKLVVFLSFWQASAISIGTSTLNLVQPNKVLAWPDLKVGIPALLLCIEMACFAVLHLWAFPYRPYVHDAPVSFYPNPDPDKPTPPRVNERSPPSGGPLGLLAIFDALNLWDFVKAFGRGMRWLMCGVKRRKEDISYKLDHSEALDMATLPDGKDTASAFSAMRPAPGFGSAAPPAPQPGVEESAGLMEYAQPHAETNSYGPYATPQRPTRPGQGPGAQTDAQARVGEALWGPR